MNLNDYTTHARGLTTEAEQIAAAKRPAYTIGDDDVLANFKRAGQRVFSTCPSCGHAHPIGAGAALAVLWLKHLDAVMSAITRPDLPQGEPVLGRFADALNYLTLAWGLHNEPDPTGPPGGRQDAPTGP